jgi:hypothetical protein
MSREFVDDEPPHGIVAMGAANPDDEVADVHRESKLPIFLEVNTARLMRLIDPKPETFQHFHHS